MEFWRRRSRKKRGRREFWRVSPFQMKDQFRLIHGHQPINPSRSVIIELKIKSFRLDEAKAKSIQPSPYSKA
jgi:hypothetical protein